MSIQDRCYAYNGVKNFLEKRGFPLHIRSGAEFYMLAYNTYKGYNKVHINKNWDLGIALAEGIQNEFGQFVTYCTNNKEDLIEGFKNKYINPHTWCTPFTVEEEQAYILSCLKLVISKNLDVWVTGRNRRVPPRFIRTKTLKNILSSLNKTVTEEYDELRKQWIEVIQTELNRRKKLNTENK